jgi:hypothetical protein
MKRIDRVFVLALALVACASAAERRVVDGKGGEDVKKRETGSVAKKIAPEGNIRTSKKVNEQFTKAADPNKGGKDTSRTSKGTGKADVKKVEVKKDLSKKGALSDAFNAGAKKSSTPPKGKDSASTANPQGNRPKPNGPKL